MDNCLACGAELIQIEKKRKKRYCNVTCRHRHWYALNWKGKVRDKVKEPEIIKEEVPKADPAPDIANAFIVQLNNCQSYEELEKVGREIETSSLSYLKKQELHRIGKSIFNQKFNL